jgi:uncharacterized protein involved in exopolysaccharide biosynthesis
MIRLFDPHAPANSLRPADGAPATSAAPRDGPSGQALFRLDLMRSLRMHPGLALGFALVGLILAALYLYMVSYLSIYTAQGLVYIQPTPSAATEAAPNNFDPATYDSYIQQQILSMTRPDVLAGAVHKLAPGVWQKSGESDQSAADRLRGAVEVARVGSSYQVAITAHANNPDTAAALANAVAASYIENAAHEQKARDAGRLAMLEEEQERIRKELDYDRARQAELNAQLGVAAIGPNASPNDDSDIARIQAELLKARADHDEAAARLASINSGSDLSSAALNAEVDRLISTDPGLSSLKQALLTLRTALVSHMSGTTPGDPQYMQDQQDLQKIDAMLQSETQNLRAKAAARIQEQLRTELDRTASQEARLNGELAQRSRAAAGAAPRLQRSSDLANDITRLQNLYNTVEEQLQNQAVQDNAPGSAHLAEAAVPPAYPAIAGVVRNALLLLFAFSLLGFAAAVVAHEMDTHGSVASDVEPLVGDGPMAHLPHVDEVSDQGSEEVLLRPPTPAVQDNREPQSLPQPAPAVPAALPEAETPAPMREPSAPEALRDIEPVFPWFAGSASQPILKPPVPNSTAAPMMPATHRIDEPMPQPESQAVPNVADEMPTHLSALRGGVFSLGIKEFSRKKVVPRDDNDHGNDHGNGPPADAAPVNPRHTIIVENFAPRPEHEPEHESAAAKGRETIARKEVPRWATPKPEFLSPPVKETNKGKQSRWNPGILGDDIQILPSRPGQYKR